MVISHTLLVEWSLPANVGEAGGEGWIPGSGRSPALLFYLRRVMRKSKEEDQLALLFYLKYFKTFIPSCVGVGNGNVLQYFCLENPRGAWRVTVAHGVAKSQTPLSESSVRAHTHTHTHVLNK